MIATGGEFTTAEQDQFCTDEMSVQSPDAVIGLRAYPNPTHDQVQLTWSAEASAESVAIIDLSGRVLQAQRVLPGASRAVLDVSGLPAGAYFVALTAEGLQPAMQRISVIH